MPSSSSRLENHRSAQRSPGTRGRTRSAADAPAALAAAGALTVPALGNAPGGLNAPAARAQNLSHLLHTIQRLQPISRVRLARTTGISTTTVTNLVHELVETGIVLEAGLDGVAATPGAGRPPVALRLNPHGACAVGVHIGVRHARIALVDLQANLLALRSLPHATPPDATSGRVADPMSMLARIAEAVTEMVAGIVPESVPESVPAGVPEMAAGAATTGVAPKRPGAPLRLVGVGVGASGLVQAGTGVNVLAPRLGWRDVPLRALLQQLLEQSAADLPDAGLRRALGNVVVENNVRTMALAESLYGVCRNARALALVYARVGVGAGLVVDRELYRGADYGAGEIGHWVMQPRVGDLCGCGNRGCLETLISEAVLLAQAETIHPELTRGRANPLQVIFDAARDGHLALVEMLEDRAFYVGLALANLVNVLNPQAILLGGWLSDAFDLIEPVAGNVMRRHAFAGMADGVDLLPTSFGAYSGVIGAAVLALEEYLFSAQANLA